MEDLHEQLQLIREGYIDSNGNILTEVGTIIGLSVLAGLIAFAIGIEVSNAKEKKIKYAKIAERNKLNAEKDAKIVEFFNKYPKEKLKADIKDDIKKSYYQK